MADPSAAARDAAPDAAVWCAGLRWPAPADAEAAARLLQRFSEVSTEAARLAATPGGAAMLRGIGGNAPYLADLAVREAVALRRVAAAGPEPVVAEALTAIAELSPDAPRATLAAALRVAKRVVALAVALADIGGAWGLDRVTGALSDLAEATLRAAVDHILRAARLPNAAGSCGLVVLGMGKLGARELNYSSDIDLVLLHDPDVSPTAVFTRIARGVVALMEARDADGYVFRTDLRLRPDPAATPPSVGLPAAIAYYESMAQNWERAAMLKARPVAGDIGMGETFLEAIRPFVWRRGLDFAAMADLHAMKQRIDEHKHGGLSGKTDTLARLAGRDLKLGQGGIREIEFLAQTLQLVWGGRDPALRTPRTVEALRRLARAGHLPPRAAGELVAAYRFLRRVEHRLQMVADRQTHSLPATGPGVAQFAMFMGFADAAGFAAVLLRHLGRVRRRYADLFAAAQAGAPENLASEPALRALGFADPAHVLAAIEGWRSGGPRALRSERARALLGEVLPGLLRALGRQAQPDAAFARLDRLFAALPAGVQLLSLFQRNPKLADRVADVLGAAPKLAEYLAGSPAALDGLLSLAAPDDYAALLAPRMADARGLEDAIAIIRASVREEDFAISVATLEGRLDADAAGVRRAALADAAVAGLLDPVLADMRRRHGEVRGGALAVVLLGKAGGREMMAGSDLDLMLVYDHPAEVFHSELAPGAPGRALAASQWYIRAVHHFVAALTAPDAGGALYAIDMRLRPSGNKGPVAVSLAAFEHYHRPGGEAWTWERMALTRARVVAGPPALRARLEQAIRAALAAAGDPATVRADAASMRARLWRDARPPGPPFAWRDAKLRPGGLVEVEFVAQALQLVHAGRDPPPLSPTTREALARLGRAGALGAADVALLARADRAWRAVLGMLRLIDARRDDGTLSGASTEALLHAARAAGAEAVDAAALRDTLEDIAGQVREAFVRLLGPIEEHDA